MTKNRLSDFLATATILFLDLSLSHLDTKVVYKVSHAVLVRHGVFEELEAVGVGNLPHELVDLGEFLLLEVHHEDALSNAQRVKTSNRQKKERTKNEHGQPKY